MECDINNTERILTEEGLYHLLQKLKNTSGSITVQEKEKLKSIEEFAQKNQNAFSSIHTNQGTLESSDPEDILNLLGKGGINVEVNNGKVYINNANDIIYRFNVNLFLTEFNDRTLSTEVEIDDRILDLIENHPDKTSVYCIGNDGNVHLNFNTYDYTKGIYEYVSYYNNNNHTYKYSTQIKTLNNHFIGILKIEYIENNSSSLDAEAISILDINRICEL